MTELLPNVPQLQRSPAKSTGILTALLGLLWFAVSHELASRSATGLLARLAGGIFIPLLQSVFLLFLLAIGWSILNSFRHRPITLRALFGLPDRSSAGREWLLGSAVGWGLALLVTLPLALSGALAPQLWLVPHAWLLAGVALLSTALETLAIEAAFRGFALRALSERLGPSWASIVLAVLYAFAANLAFGNWVGMLVSCSLALLLSIAWFRTHGLWLGWGLHFAWNIALGLIFGLPVVGSADLSSLVQTQPQGPRWLTGSGFGPSCAILSFMVVLASIPVLMRLTRDYAWNYTHAPIVPAGYPMDVPPPPAHTAMEKAAPPPPLVQIAPATPQERSRTEPPL